MGMQLICNEHDAGSNPAAGSQRPIRISASTSRSQREESGSTPLWGISIIAWGSLVSRDLRAVEIIGSNPIAVTFVQGAHLGVVKLGITRRLGRRDRWFESSHLDFYGATSQLAMAPVSKTGELDRLIGSTPIRSASCVIRLTARLLASNQTMRVRFLHGDWGLV